MGPYLHLSTYSQDFRSPGHTRPSQARPTSSYRRNKPHVHPDFLLPRKPQTGYGCRPMFPKIGPSNTAPLFPPLSHASIQCPERKRSQSQSELNPMPKPKPEKSAVAMPPAGCLSKPQPTDNTKAQGTTRNLQGGGYSCFQVVKPYKAGYYIIHPEFVSEIQH